jgi:hypothetical protein
MVHLQCICGAHVSHGRLEIFLPHRHQCGLEIHVGRMRDSLTLPPSQQRHPVLMNAIFLWSCYVSRPGPLSQHESHYLSRALEGLNDAMQYADKIIDVIQGSCLISMYFLSNGRVLEGSYHANAAASLSVQWGLHGGIPNAPSLGFSDPVSSCKLESHRCIIVVGASPRSHATTTCCWMGGIMVATSALVSLYSWVDPPKWHSI